MHPFLNNNKLIFANSGVYSSEYIPDRLISREEELDILKQIFQFLTQNPGKDSSTVLIWGPPGSGKTVTAKYFGMNLKKLTRQINIRLEYVHLNNYEVQSRKSILKQLLSSVRLHYRQGSIKKMRKMLIETLERENIHLLLIIDEIKSLPINRTVMNLLTEINSSCPSKRQRLSL
ncbi:MAG: AAA family ATPase, partial [Candidatus Hodarchaeota archaeon]